MKRSGSTIAVLAGMAVLATAALAQQPRRPAGPRGQGPGGPGRFNPVLRLFDADGDGTLSATEIDGAAAKLKELDTSGDGKLADDELRPAMPPGPPGFPGAGRGPGRGPGRATPPADQYENPLLPKDDDEKAILDGLEAMREGRRFANVSTSDGRLLRLLTEAVGAKRVIEIGTSTGESAVWFSMALRKTGGHLDTHEIDPEMAKTARANFKRAGVDDLVTIVEGDAHETVKKQTEPIDVLFLDADKEGYIDYLQKLLPLVRPGGLVIAHNMRGPTPDPRYIKAITQDPKLETSFLLMDGAGVGVTLKKR